MQYLDFEVGLKVELKGECGIVINSYDANNLIGLIRWDTLKDNI